MRALLQRVTQAHVDVDGQTIGRCGAGLLIFVCAMQGDTVDHAAKLALKISKLRMFRDESGRMNRSILDINGSALVISQFTLAADTSRGNRPGFSNAAPPEVGKALYHEFVAQLTALHVPCETGEFGADMAVHLVNDGPVTLWVET